MRLVGFVLTQACRCFSHLLLPSRTNWPQTVHGLGGLIGIALQPQTPIPSVPRMYWFRTVGKTPHVMRAPQAMWPTDDAAAGSPPDPGDRTSCSWPPAARSSFSRSVSRRSVVALDRGAQLGGQRNAAQRLVDPTHPAHQGAPRRSPMACGSLRRWAAPNACGHSARCHPSAAPSSRPSSACGLASACASPSHSPSQRDTGTTGRDGKRDGTMSRFPIVRARVPLSPFVPVWGQRVTKTGHRALHFCPFLRSITKPSATSIRPALTAAARARPKAFFFASESRPSTTLS